MEFTFVDIIPYPVWYSGKDVHYQNSSLDGTNFFDQERHVLAG